MSTRGRSLRIGLIAVAAVVVLVVGAGAIALTRFDPNAYKPEIIQAVRHATGRDLALNGKISLKPSFWPTIQVADVTFSNPPGFSRPQMASLQGMELQLGLLPLLSSRLEINRLVLIRPDIRLETDAAGHPNWQLTPEVSPSAPAGTQTPVKSGTTTTAVSIASILIQDGSVGYRDDRTGNVTTLGLPRLDVKAASADAPLHVDADASYNGTGFSLAGDTGSLSRLQDAAAATPWPVKLALTVGAARLAVEGTLTQPLQGKGYDLAVNGTVPDMSALAPLLQGTKPPPLHDVNFTTRIADKGGKFPEVSALTLHVGASDLSLQVPGLIVSHLDIAASAADQPVKVDGAGRLGEQPISLVATSGPLALLLPEAKSAPFPLDAILHVGGATLSAKGSIADAQAKSGASIALAAQIPDLSVLSPLVRRPLPAVRQVAFKATLTDAPGGFRSGAALHGLSFTSTEGDLAGDVAVSLQAKTFVTAALTSNRIDMDALQAVVDQTPAAGPAQPSDAGNSAPSRPKRTELLFSDQKLPFGMLRMADGDLKLNIGDLHSGGSDYKAISTHAVVKDGRLTVQPFVADLPGGHLSGTVSVDATQAAPPVHVTLHAPGLALKSILLAAHQLAFANGNLEVYGDLQGAGQSLHAIASTLDGSLGLAIAGGTLDNRLIGSLLGKVMDSLNALDLVGKGGASELKCFALRMDARHGVGNLPVLALSSSLLTMTGGGSVNLGDETLALALYPHARVAGTDVVIPVNMVGPIRNPTVRVNKLGTAESNAGTVAGAFIGGATPLGIVGGLLGGDKLLGGGTSDICTPALAASRGQTVPASVTKSPTNGAADPGANRSGAPNAGTILKNLFR